MGGVSKEDGVLKLVRAGGIVELYNHPITAAEVMKRYPRHFVTRPDVFKYPHIVVKPESVLKLGRVFFIVPYHTIRRLLQSRAVEYSHPLIESKRTLIKQSSDQKMLYDMDNIDNSFFNQMIIPFEDSKIKKHHDHAKFSVDKTRVCKDGDYDSDADPGCFTFKKMNGKANNTSLKPCLKKHGRNHKTRSQQGPRVRFKVPDDDEKPDTNFSE